MTKLKPRIKCPICGKEWLWIEQYTYTATSLDIEAIPECRQKNKMLNKFDEWYKLYPKKMAPKEAKKAFVANIKTEEEFNKLMEGTEGFINYHAKKGTEKQFMPYPAPFIRGGHYLSDDYKKKLDNGNNVLYTNDGDEIVIYDCKKCGKKPIVPIVIEGIDYCQECSLKF